jgi:hypothetical protein
MIIHNCLYNNLLKYVFLLFKIVIKATFKVDITFNEFLYDDLNTFDHLGLISTDLVLQWS